MRHADPRRFDLTAAADQGAEVRGEWPVAQLLRLAADHPADAPQPPGDVTWAVRASRHGAAGTGGDPWLRVQAAATVWRTCQRCLQPVALDLRVDRSIRFVDGEDAAAALDADSDDDVLALPPRLDLCELVEDELLLALPLVPHHEPACPNPLPHRAGQADTEHPFAALAVLKRPGAAH